MEKTKLEQKKSILIQYTCYLLYCTQYRWVVKFQLQSTKLTMYILSHVTHWKFCSNFVGPALCLRYYRISFSYRIYQISSPQAMDSTTHLTLLHSVAELMRQMTRKMACFFSTSWKWGLEKWKWQQPFQEPFASFVFLQLDDIY